jgi:hypothetical protein
MASKTQANGENIMRHKYENGGFWLPTAPRPELARIFEESGVFDIAVQNWGDTSFDRCMRILRVFDAMVSFLSASHCGRLMDAGLFDHWKTWWEAQDVPEVQGLIVSIIGGWVVAVPRDILDPVVDFGNPPFELWVPDPLPDFVDGDDVVVLERKLTKPREATPALLGAYREGNLRLVEMVAETLDPASFEGCPADAEDRVPFLRADLDSLPEDVRYLVLANVVFEKEPVKLQAAAEETAERVAVHRERDTATERAKPKLLIPACNLVRFLEHDLFVELKVYAESFQTNKLALWGPDVLRDPMLSRASLAQAAAYYGAVKCLKMLNDELHFPMDEVARFALAGHNVEVIQYCIALHMATIVSSNLKEAELIKAARAGDAIKVYNALTEEGAPVTAAVLNAAVLSGNVQCALA